MGLYLHSIIIFMIIIIICKIQGIFQVYFAQNIEKITFWMLIRVTYELPYDYNFIS